MQIENERLQRIQETRNRNETRKKTGAKHENGQIVRKNETIESDLNTHIERSPKRVRQTASGKIKNTVNRKNTVMVPTL